MTFYIQDYKSYSVSASEAPPPTPPPTPAPPWWEQTFLGLPVWAWMLIGGAGAAGVGALAYAEERRREQLLLTLATKK